MTSAAVARVRPRDHQATAERASEPDPRRMWTLLVLCLSLFMVVMGNTVLNVALPSISKALHASGTHLQWMVDSYARVRGLAVHGRLVG